MVSLVPNSCPQGTRDKKAFSGLRILKQEFGCLRTARREIVGR